VPPHRLRVAVQADAYLDPQALERSQHRTVQERPVGLQGHVHLGRHAGTERADQVGQPLGARQQRLAAVQDDVDAREGVPAGMLGNPLHRLADHRLVHSLGQSPPALICHFIDIAVRAGQVTPAVDFQDKLPERDGLMPRFPDCAHIKLE
jgi:hypothetical protein